MSNIFIYLTIVFALLVLGQRILINQLKEEINDYKKELGEAKANLKATNIQNEKLMNKFIFNK